MSTLFVEEHMLQLALYEESAFLSSNKLLYQFGARKHYSYNQLIMKNCSSRKHYDEIKEKQVILPTLFHGHINHDSPPLYQLLDNWRQDTNICPGCKLAIKQRNYFDNSQHQLGGLIFYGMEGRTIQGERIRGLNEKLQADISYVIQNELCEMKDFVDVEKIKQ